jgi:hypothetical protein
MRARNPHAGRSAWLLVLSIAVAGIVGSVLSYFLAGLFPTGPVRDFFFKALDIGIPTFKVSLGFLAFTFGLTFSISTFAVLLVGLAIYIWYKL